MSSVALSPSAVLAPSAPRRSVSGGWGRYARLGLAAVVAAVLANVLVSVAGDAAIGYAPDFVVLATVGGIVLFTLVPAVVAMLRYAALLRDTRAPERIFAAVSAVVFVVTTVPDFTSIPGVEGASAGQAAVLVLMRVVAAAVIVGLLTRYGRSR